MRGAGNARGSDSLNVATERTRPGRNITAGLLKHIARNSARIVDDRYILAPDVAFERPTYPIRNNTFSLFHDPVHFLCKSELGIPNTPQPHGRDIHNTLFAQVLFTSEQYTSQSFDSIRCGGYNSFQIWAFTESTGSCYEKEIKE